MMDITNGKKRNWFRYADSFPSWEIVTDLDDVDHATVMLWGKSNHWDAVASLKATLDSYELGVLLDTVLSNPRPQLREVALRKVLLHLAGGDADLADKLAKIAAILTAQPDN